MTVRRGTFTSRDQRLAYTIYGNGTRPLVYLPGLLMPARMNAPLAEYLAARGHRVILLDPLGQGESARPCEMWRYSIGQFAIDVVALLDHLDIDRAVVGGTSLGANISLEVAALAPQRLRGMVLEMPVLDNALVANVTAFGPLLLAMTLGESIMQGVSRLARLVPSSPIPLVLDALLDTVRQDPRPSGALLTGTFFGRTAPPRDLRRTFTAPALVIGHHRDPVHPFADAGMLSEELPNGRLVEAGSILEMRLHPARLHGEIATFLDQVWGPDVRVVGGRGRRRPAAARPPGRTPRRAAAGTAARTPRRGAGPQ